MKTDLDKPFTSEISRRLARVLNAAGLTTPRQVLDADRFVLQTLRGMGAKTREEVRDRLVTWAAAADREELVAAFGEKRVALVEEKATLIEEQRRIAKRLIEIDRLLAK